MTDFFSFSGPSECSLLLHPFVSKQSSINHGMSNESYHKVCNLSTESVTKAGDLLLLWINNTGQSNKQSKLPNSWESDSLPSFIISSP